MLESVRSTIEKYRMLAPGDGVIVGLSGGVDSVTLLSALLALRDELNLSIYAVHINHNLRGDAAHKDEGFARLLCKSWGIPLLVFQADVQGFATEQKLSIEEAGRKIRYKYLRQGLAEFNAHKIAVGHNQDDNAETILLNLFRGTGLKGLGGIPPVNGQIIRPLIEVSRQKIEAYAKENNLQYSTDQTNASSDYTRNYIRNQVLPVVREHFGDKVSETMARNAFLLRADEEALSAAALEAFNMTAYISETEITLPIETLLSYSATPTHSNISTQITGQTHSPTLAQPTSLAHTPSPALPCRIIRQAISRLRGELALEDIRSSHIEAILDIVQGRTGREASLPGFKARKEYTNLVLYRPTPQETTCNPSTSKTLNQDFCHLLSPGIPLHLPPLTITLSLTPPENQSQSHCTHSFNYDKVNQTIELRTRRPGDKITLEGGTKKLQDYFTDTKTPRNQRDTTLLLASGSNILWIMDKHNRKSTAYNPTQAQNTCWIEVTSNPERIIQ